MPTYSPDQRDVQGRVDNGAHRARHDYGFPPEHVTASGIEVWHKLEERIDAAGGQFRCYLCGRRLDLASDWHLDHVIPLVLRGAHAVDNLEAACSGCNLTKGGMSLEDLLGPRLYDAFNAGGGLPPFRAMRERPVAELWGVSPAVARRFSRRPREVERVGWDDHWYHPVTNPWGGLDRRIGGVLARQPDPFVALPTTTLAPLLGFAGVTNLDDNYWLRCMGLNDRTGKDWYHDNRLVPSPLVIATRTGGRRGAKAFRLRDMNALSELLQATNVDQIDFEDLPQVHRRVPDQDQFNR